MELVYLFTSKDFLESVKSFSYSINYFTGQKGSPIDKDIQNIGVNRFIVTFFINSNSCEAARDLSELNNSFSKSFESNCQCLADGASAYYNKTLFPKMNEFERLLREYIYLKQQISIASLEEQIKQAGNSELKEHLQKKKTMIANLFQKKPLEELDFTEIYTRLFVDSKFCDAIKRKFFPDSKEKTGKEYKTTKDEYINFINNQEEHVIWTDLSDKQLDIIKINYQKIKGIRNDIMHAHNIDYSQFHEAENLMKKVLDELKLELSKIISIPVSTLNIEGIVTALRQFAITLDPNYSDFNRRFSQIWVDHSHQLDGIIDDELRNELLIAASLEREEKDAVTV